MGERRTRASFRVTWYLDKIEPGIREAVRLLRDNGFNTTGSCHHVKMVEGDPVADGELKRMCDLLHDAGHRDFHVAFDVYVRRGVSFSRFKVEFLSATQNQDGA